MGVFFVWVPLTQTWLNGYTCGLLHFCWRFGCRSVALQVLRDPVLVVWRVLTVAQGCLGGWNIMSLISLVTYLITVVMICKECEPVFSIGNSTCVLNETNAGSPTGEILLVDESDCYGPQRLLTGVVSGMLMLCMAIASCSAAFHGRKTGKAKMVHVITVEPIRVDISSLTLETPQNSRGFVLDRQ